MQPSTLHESRTATTSAPHLLPKLHSLAESNPHLNLLDAGCGPGTISTSFAQLLPNGHVTGLDLNTAILPRARQNAAAAGVTNIDFVEGSVFTLPFADESFDVVFCHQVLIHLGQPWEALREMLRVAKKGGVVAAREGDYGSEVVWPGDPALGRFHELMAGVMRAGGGTPEAGRQLLAWALKAGAERRRVEVSFGTSSYCTWNERRFCAQGLCEQLRGGGLRAKAMKFELGEDEDFEEMAKAWEEWAERDNSSLAMLQGQILIQK
ncbi:hypothetical protein DPSP01_000900 [Paraphaeosphaeria sporulosa]